MVGYGKAVYSFRKYASTPLRVSKSSQKLIFSHSQYWIWCPVMGPILGGQAGGLFYDAFLFTGEESIFNKPCVLSPGPFFFWRTLLNMIRLQ